MNRQTILLSCGSFNPPTIAHLRMMEVARDYLSFLPNPYSVIEGIFSPASSTYVHKPLADDEHRIAMLSHATISSSWLRVDDWEVRKGDWSRTRQVLNHHRECARIRLNDPNLSCMLVCGGDLVESFNRILPDGTSLWEEDDVRAIVMDFGLIVVNREGSNPLTTLGSFGFPRQYMNIITDEAIPNDVSSTRLRQQIENGRSIRYCTPDGVIDYIEKHGLYNKPNGFN